MGLDNQNRSMAWRGYITYNRKGEKNDDVIERGEL